MCMFASVISHPRTRGCGTRAVHAQPSSAACDPLELHGKAHTQYRGNASPMEGNGRTRVAGRTKSRCFGSLSRCGARHRVGTRRSPRRKRAHRPGQRPGLPPRKVTVILWVRSFKEKKKISQGALRESQSNMSLIKGTPPLRGVVPFFPLSPFCLSIL